MQRWWDYSYFQFAYEDLRPQRGCLCVKVTQQDQYSHPVIPAPESLYLTLFQILVRKVKTEVRTHYPWRRRKERHEEPESDETELQICYVSFFFSPRKSEKIWLYLFPRAHITKYHRLGS